MSIHIGFTIPQRGALFGLGTIPELLEQAVAAEMSGAFDSIWVGDSLTAKPRPEALTLLGALAGMTQRVQLGVGCMASFPVRDPAQFAYQWATLDQISSGRMLLAACTGIVSADRASNKEGDHFGGVRDVDRAARLEEGMALCRQLWTGASVTHHGRFYEYDDITIVPAPMQDPCPIWIAANPTPGRFWERILQRVAIQSDGWMTVVMSPGSLGRAVADLTPLLADAGKTTFPIMAYHNVNIGADRQQCLAESKRFLDAYYGPVFSTEVTEAWTAAGSPQQCADDLRQLAEQGATHISLRATSWDQPGQFTRLVDEVLPLLA